MGTECGASTEEVQKIFVVVALHDEWHALNWLCEERMVLDVGCGRGDFSDYELLLRMPKDMSMVATDACLDTVARAAEKHRDPRIAFLQFDVATAHLEDTGVWRLAPFGKVFSLFGLHWIQDQRTAFQNINKLLSSDGEAFFIIITHSKLFTMYETMAMSPRWSMYMEDYQKFVTPYQKMKHPDVNFKGYMKEVGLTVKTCRHKRNIRYVTEDDQKVADVMRMMNPFVGRMPSEMREPFIRECVREAFRNGTLSTIQLSNMANMPSHSFHYDALVAHVAKP